MKNYKRYYLAITGNINDRWNVIRKYHLLINRLAKGDEEHKQDIIANTIFKFDYVSEKVRIYFKDANIFNFS